MWIFLGIVAFLAALITVILLLPVYVIVKTDENGEPLILYKLLWRTFGENPDPNNPITVALKKTTGIDKLKKESLLQGVEETNLQLTVQQTLNIVIDLLKEAAGLLKRCTMTKLELDVVCSTGDAAETAISYGKTCAFVYPFVGAIHALMKVRRRGKKVTVRCDFTGKEADTATYHFVLYVRLFRALAALLRISVEEAKREVAREEAREQTRRMTQPSQSKKPQSR